MQRLNHVLRSLAFISSLTGAAGAGQALADEPAILAYRQAHTMHIVPLAPVTDDQFSANLEALLTRLETQDDVLWVGYPWSRVVTGSSAGEHYADYIFTVNGLLPNGRR